MMDGAIPLRQPVRRSGRGWQQGRASERRHRPREQRAPASRLHDRSEAKGGRWAEAPC